MRRISLLPVFFVLIGSLLVLAAPARAQSWAWGLQTRSVGYGIAGPAYGATAVSLEGDTYVAGSFGDTVQFGPTRLIAGDTTVAGSGGGAVFITKVSAAGEWRWSVAARGGSYSETLVADPLGGAIVFGGFSDTLRLGAITLFNSNGNASYFMARISAQGVWTWATITPYGANIRRILPDAAGNLIVAGYVTLPSQFGATTLIPRGNANGFVAKLMADGQWRWAVLGGGSQSDGIHGAAAGPGGITYVTGSYSADATFGALRPPVSGENTGFVAALSPEGAWQWVEPIASELRCIGTSLLAAPGTGELLVGGWLNGTATFGATTLAAQPGDLLAEAFVARLDPATRTWRWATSAGGPESIDAVYSLALDPAGTAVYAGGSFGVARYNGLPGAIATARFGTQTMMGFGGADGFIGRLDAATGQWQNAVVWGSTHDDAATGLVALTDGNGLVLSGVFTGPAATVGPHTLTTNVTPYHSEEVLIARLELAPLGLTSATEDVTATLAPNPARTTTTLTLAPEAAARSVVVLDAVGRTVRTATVLAYQTTSTLDLRGLPAGLYVVRVGNLTRRLVIAD